MPAFAGMTVKAAVDFLYGFLSEQTKLLRQHQAIPKSR